jgi:signal transduction histidine kinase
MNSLPENEDARLAALAAYEIMDTASEAEFDSLTQLAAYIAGTPISLISLLDNYRQWFKSKVGIPIHETPREQAFCLYTIQGNHPFEVPDAKRDVRFMDNPLVKGAPNIGYYCGVPLVTTEGFRLGSLCVIDKQPRVLSAEQIKALETLANEVMARLELKRQKKQIEMQKLQLLKANDLLERQVQQRTSELSASNRALMQTKIELDTFLYRASHDLKGPLCSLQGLLQLVQMESSSTQIEHYMEMMQRSSQKLNLVLDRLLTYSYNVSSNLMRESIKFDSLLEDTLQSCQNTKGWERVTIQTHVEGTSPFYSDSGRIRSILVNLVQNGITFQNFSTSSPQLTIRIQYDIRQATFTIHDNGIGICPKHIERGFPMFTKYSLQSTGPGLGLYIVSKIIQKLGGCMDIQSQEFEGTTVTVKIPNELATHKTDT